MKNDKFPKGLMKKKRIRTADKQLSHFHFLKLHLLEVDILHAFFGISTGSNLQK